MADKIGIYSVPAVMVVVGIMLLASNSDLFSEFLEGAKEGMKTCVGILPTLIILITAVKMFSASGALDALCGILGKGAQLLGFPSELLPVMIMRPISGSAATATVKQLFESSGADSFAGRCASIIMGASDTIIYTFAMYFGAVGVKKTRHALPAAFLTLVFCAAVSLLLTKIFF